jgi:hypothetical protein
MEENPAGSYEVELDTSKLSDGVYIDQLNVNEFINTKRRCL